MSMIMRIARGAPDELERLATNGWDDAAVPAAMAGLLNGKLPALANLPPEIREQLLARLQAHPQRGGLPPLLLEGLRRGLTIVPSTAEAAQRAGGGRQRPRAVASQPETIDLHKSWHVFHFLFTGRSAEGGTPPANLLLEGGREVGEDMGYGPARLLDPADTAAFARFTEGLTVEELKRRIDASRMASLGIYCAGEGSHADAEELAADVALYFPRLQAHFQAAAHAGQSTLVWLS